MELLNRVAILIIFSTLFLSYYLTLTLVLLSLSKFWNAVRRNSIWNLLKFSIYFNWNINVLLALMMENDEGSGDSNSNKSLPSTSRVCSKILEYYKKFGYKRDLEKYLRIYSPTEENNVEKPCKTAAHTTKTRTRIKTNSDYQSNDYMQSLKSLKAASISRSEATKKKGLKQMHYSDEATTTQYLSVLCIK